MQCSQPHVRPKRPASPVSGSAASRTQNRTLPVLSPPSGVPASFPTASSPQLCGRVTCVMRCERFVVDIAEPAKVTRSTNLSVLGKVKRARRQGSRGVVVQKIKDY